MKCEYLLRLKRGTAKHSLCMHTAIMCAKFIPSIPPPIPDKLPKCCPEEPCPLKPTQAEKESLHEKLRLYLERKKVFGGFGDWKRNLKEDAEKEEW